VEADVIGRRPIPMIRIAITQRDQRAPDPGSRKSWSIRPPPRGQILLRSE
jgi:hypothetical protein